MIRFKKLVLAAMLALGASAGAANASVMYTLTLTPTVGSVSGTGSFTISSAPLTGINQQSTYDQNPTAGHGTLEAFSITLGGDTFNFTTKNNAVNPTLRFTTGVLDSIGYAGTTANGDSLMISSSYVYFVPANQSQTIGTFRATLAPVPEPVTLSIFGVGLAGAAALRRRKKAMQA